MKIKRISLLAVTLLLLASGAGALTDLPTWQRYRVKDEQFSFALPAQPSVEHRRIFKEAKGERLETTLARFSDGVLYLIVVFENPSPKQSLDSFIKDRVSARLLNKKTEKKLTLDEVSGKAFSLQGIDGAVQFFSKGDRLFQFGAYNAVPGDVRVTKFFSSISLVNNKDSIEVSQTALPPLTPATTATTSTIDTPEKIFTPQEVDQSYKPIMNPHAEYTEMARQNQVTGTIVLQCTLNANGTITRIRVVTGLPYGLTERAIAAARGLKFIPAMKEGKYVSVSTRLVYTFDLF